MNIEKNIKNKKNANTGAIINNIICGVFPIKRQTRHYNLSLVKNKSTKMLYIDIQYQLKAEYMHACHNFFSECLPKVFII